MFSYEANMVNPVIQWMESRRLIIKSEFITPWGMCDLVGLEFRKRHVAERLRLRQSQPVSSLTSASLLLSIPEHRTMTFQKLSRMCSPIISDEVFSAEMHRLVRDRFVCYAGGRLQRLNGWMPLHKQLIAIELKLSRVEEAMAQAWNNLSFAEKSYVALPRDVAIRVKSRQLRWSPFIKSGVGVLSVTAKSCDVVIPSKRCPSYKPDPVLQFYCVEKFWRTSKGNLA